MGEASDAAHEAADKGKRAARTVESSTAYQWLVRVGLVAYGLVHLLVAWLAIRLAVGLRGNGEEASNTGALRSLAQAPLGAELLWVVAVGFVALALWQGVTALVGYTEFDARKRLLKRLGSASRVLLYAYLGVAAAQVASGPQPGGGDQGPQSLSSRLLGLPFGQVLVALVGAAIVAVGVVHVVRAFRKTFNDDLDTTLSGVPERLTQAGFVAKGVAIGIVGGLFGWAALASDASRAGGLDRALHEVLNQPFGFWLLLALGAGIGAYGVYCFFWARHPKHA